MPPPRRRGDVCVCSAARPRTPRVNPCQDLRPSLRAHHRAKSTTSRFVESVCEDRAAASGASARLWCATSRHRRTPHCTAGAQVAALREPARQFCRMNGYVKLPLPLPPRRAYRMAMPSHVPDLDWTVERALALPDDGMRYEVLDGELFVTPSPTWGFSRRSRRYSTFPRPMRVGIGLDGHDAPRRTSRSRHAASCSRICSWCRRVWTGTASG